MMNDMAISLVSQYFATVAALGPDAPLELFVAANTLLIHLAIVLPASMFRVVRDAGLCADADAIFNAVITIRAAMGAMGSLTQEDAILHQQVSERDPRSLH